MTTYRTIEADGTEIFYREAGDPAAPTLLLLEGFPSSSAQYEQLIGLLADRYHLVAPDYPGFGRSPALAGKTTFDRLAAVIDRFTEAKRLERFSVYMFDFGAPGRISTRHAPPRTHRGARDPERQRVRRGPRAQDAAPEAVLGRRRRQHSLRFAACWSWTSPVHSTSTALRIRRPSTRISGNSTSGTWISPAATA
jgi:hypothetical protein